MYLNINKNIQSDILGASASTLCLIHCLATPFLFFAYTNTNTQAHHEVPFWWGTIDIIFMLISLFAVYWSVKKCSKQWVKNTLWLSWFGLAFVILNEKLAFIQIPEFSIYIPAISLVALHFYNKKYCTCKDNNCSIDKTADLL